MRCTAGCRVLVSVGPSGGGLPESPCCRALCFFLPRQSHRALCFYLPALYLQAWATFLLLNLHLSCSAAQSRICDWAAICSVSTGCSSWAHGVIPLPSYCIELQLTFGFTHQHDDVVLCVASCFSFKELVYFSLLNFTSLLLWSYHCSLSSKGAPRSN